MHAFDLFDPIWSRDPQKDAKNLQNDLFWQKFGAEIVKNKPDLHLFAYYLGRQGFRVINGYYSGIIRVFNWYFRILPFLINFDPLTPSLFQYLFLILIYNILYSDNVKYGKVLKHLKSSFLVRHII